MKRIAFAGLLLGLIAGTPLAQLRGQEPDSLSSDDLVTPMEKLSATASQHDVDSLTSEDLVTPIAASDAAEEESSRLESPTAVIKAIRAASHDAKIAECDHCHRAAARCCCAQRGLTFFGEWLLLQPRDANIVYAVRARTCFEPPLDAEQLDFGTFSGFKIGVAKALCDNCSGIAVSWTHFEANQSDRAAPTRGTDVLRPVLAFDPFATCDDSTSSSARANASINFDRVAIDYRSYIDHDCFRFDWLVGFGYGQLTQDVTAVYDAGRVNVDTEAWGYGVRLGGGAEYRHGCVRGFGHADLTLLASNVKALYREIDDGTGVVNTNARFDQDLDRIIPVLDLELGVAWDMCKNTTLKVGYTYSFWFNVVSVPDFVRDVQRGNLTGSSDTLTFDGLFARIEYDW